MIELRFFALAAPNVLTGAERTQHVLIARNEYNIIIIYLNLMSSGTEVEEEEVGLIFVSTSYDLCVVLWRVPARVSYAGYRGVYVCL